MTKWSNTINIKDMEIKTTMKYHLTLVILGSTERLKMIGAGKDAVRGKFCTLLVGM